MKNTKWIAITIILSGFWLTAACSKKLLPPEIESASAVDQSGVSGGTSGSGTGGEAAASEGSRALGGSDQPFAAEPQLEKGFFSEEKLAGSGSAGEEPKGGADSSGFAMGKPSDGEGGSSGMGMPGDGGSGAAATQEGIQEARLLPFRSSSDLSDIHFAFDRYDLDDQSRSVLSQNASYLKMHPNVRVEIQGHCDERGTSNYNIALGERRASSTKKFLMAQGVDESRLHTISYGEEKPFCSESNEGCWSQNRRAHFMVAE